VRAVSATAAAGWLEGVNGARDRRGLPPKAGRVRPEPKSTLRRGARPRVQAGPWFAAPPSEPGPLPFPGTGTANSASTGAGSSLEEGRDAWDVVDAEVLCAWTTTDGVPCDQPAGREFTCPAHADAYAARVQARADHNAKSETNRAEGAAQAEQGEQVDLDRNVEVTVTSVTASPSTSPDPEVVVGELEDEHDGQPDHDQQDEQDEQEDEMGTWTRPTYEEGFRHGWESAFYGRPRIDDDGSPYGRGLAEGWRRAVDAGALDAPHVLSVVPAPQRGGYFRAECQTCTFAGPPYFGVGEAGYAGPVWHQRTHLTGADAVLDRDSYDAVDAWWAQTPDEDGAHTPHGIRCAPDGVTIPARASQLPHPHGAHTGAGADPSQRHLQLVPTIPGAALAPVITATTRVAANEGNASMSTTTNAPANASTTTGSTGGAPGPRTPSGDRPAVPYGHSGSTSATSSIGGELRSLRDFKAETAQVAALIEQFEALGRQIKEWSVNLPDRFAAAPFATAGLTSAVSGIAEHGGRSNQLREHLGIVEREISRAESLGEQVSALRASGHAEAFVPQ
jgi:hypothetical protein